MELWPVGLRDAQQLADHPEGERTGVSHDQVDRATRAECGEIVEQGIRGGANRRLEGGDPRRDEGPGHQSAQPGVVGGIDVEHVPGVGGAWKPIGDDVRRLVERSEHVLRQT